MHSIAVATCRNLSHRYQNHAALDDINLDLQAGEITVLLGPNGAGKTTLIHLLLGLVQVQQGTITVWGQAAGRREARQHTGATQLVVKLLLYDRTSWSATSRCRV
ncbi:MAG: ATP-binding cassette domain-containing protein [Gammaproteobacteria bacterium]|jgi:ABC-type multidrug transport system ATPase subunit|nr:ATP-binding cassette domain-containing protein [Gammaproteobacteria bacterium]